MILYQPLVLSARIAFKQKWMNEVIVKMMEEKEKEMGKYVGCKQSKRSRVEREGMSNKVRNRHCYRDL